MNMPEHPAKWLEDAKKHNGGCPDCNGTGDYQYSGYTCPSCNGTGTSAAATPDAQNNLRGESAVVPGTITAVHPVVGSGEQEDPTLIARREGEREALQKMIEWNEYQRRLAVMLAHPIMALNYSDTITELRRRLAEGETT